MSLLIDALKRAERAKAGQGEAMPAADVGGSPEPTLDTTKLSLEPVEAPLPLEPTENVGGKPEPKFNEDGQRLTKSLPERLAEQRSEVKADLTRPPTKPAFTTKKKTAPLAPDPQQGAQGLFAAKQKTAEGKSRVGLFALGGVALLLLAAGGFYIWYTLSFPPSPPMANKFPPPQVAVPPPQARAPSPTAPAPAVEPLPSAQVSPSNPSVSDTANSTAKEVPSDPGASEAMPSAVAATPRPAVAATAMVDQTPRTATERQRDSNRAPRENAANDSASAMAEAPTATRKDSTRIARRAKSSARSATTATLQPDSRKNATTGESEEAFVSADGNDEATPSAALNTAQASSSEASAETPRSTRKKRSARGKRSEQTASNTLGIQRSAPELAVVDPDLMAAYEALVSGDRASAKQLYETALKSDPFSIDANLGLAAIAVATGDSAKAQRYYRRALEIDPQNSAALAGMASVRGASPGVPLEPRIKSQLAAEPTSAPLNFALGNEFAVQGRWAEAQQAYFDAHRLDSQNPDYAYNLAVSLDQLNQVKQALFYYQRAEQLLGKRSAQFSASTVRARIQELQQ